MNCPKCGGPMWDNTAPGAKKNPKGPDFKCKDQECKHAVWLDKPKATPKVAAPAANGTTPDWKVVMRDYSAAATVAARGLAKALGCELKDLDQQAVQAGAATILIRLDKWPTAAPKPKPPVVAELSEVPAALAEDEDTPF